MDKHPVYSFLLEEYLKHIIFLSVAVGLIAFGVWLAEDARSEPILIFFRKKQTTLSEKEGLVQSEDKADE